MNMIIFEIVIGILTIIGISFNLGRIRTFGRLKLRQLSDNMERDNTELHIKLAKDILRCCIAVTNQTYVDELKADNRFGLAEQESARLMTTQLFLITLGKDTKKVLSKIFGDLDLWIKVNMEDMIAESKKKEE